MRKVLFFKEAVHKMYWEHYNQMAIKIQKVWRGHFVRSHVFSYYKLKRYINDILHKNKKLLELAKVVFFYLKYVLQINAGRKLKAVKSCFNLTIQNIFVSC